MPPLCAHRSKENPGFIIILAVLVAAIYIWSLLPGIGYSGDTANLQFVGYVLGTTHPTGYPLYTLINFLLSA